MAPPRHGDAAAALRAPSSGPDRGDAPASLLGTSELAEPSLRERLDLTIFLFLLFVGMAVVGERLRYPEQATAVTLMYASMVAICVGAAVLIRLAAFRDHVVAIGVGAMAAASWDMAGYSITFGTPVDRFVLVQVSHLVGLLVMMPWGWRAQATFALAAMAGYAVAAPHLRAPDTHLYAAVSLLTASVTTVWGAYFLERYRRLLRREADIAAALAYAGQRLNTQLNVPHMLARVNELAVEILGCDWSSTFIWDEARQAYRLEANVGSRPEVAAELAQLEFSASSLPMLDALAGHDLIELSDAAGQDLVPPAIMDRFEAASALYVPMRSGATTLGILVHGYRTRRGAFSATQRRLALGLAHTAAIAAQNARLIADLQTANSLKSEFVSTMSHELRTPLNVILGYTDLLREDAFTPLADPQREPVDRIRHSAGELLDLVNATLDLNRLDAGRHEVVAAPIDLDALCTELHRELEPLAAPGVTLRWRNTVADALVSDRVKLKTILKNLVGNALKFTAAGSVDVAMRGVGADVQLEVRDTGIGIRAEDLPVIFDVFRQGDGSDKRSFGGVGLGLHIVRRMVALLGGRIDVASTLGQGSTFTVTLPSEGATSTPGLTAAGPGTVPEPADPGRAMSAAPVIDAGA